MCFCAYSSPVEFIEINGITKCHANRLDVISTSQVKVMCDTQTAGKTFYKIHENNTCTLTRNAFFRSSCFDLFSFPFLWPHYLALVCVFFSCFLFGWCVTFHIWCLSIIHLLFIDLSLNSNFSSKNHKKVHRLVEMIQFIMCGGGVFTQIKSNYSMTQYNCLLMQNVFVFRLHFFISILLFFGELK